MVCHISQTTQFLSYRDAMKAFILAAGYGRRMRPLTNYTHKTLLKVDEETIISRIVIGLLENEISDIVVVTGYRADELENYLLSTFPKVQFTFVKNERYLDTNNIFSLALAFEKVPLNDDIVLIESDLIYDAQVIERAINSPFKNVALVCRYHAGLDGTVVTVSNEKITNVIPPHLQDENFDFSDKYKTLNIYKLEQSFCENEFKTLLTYYARTIDDNCYYELILGILIYMQKKMIYAEIIKDEKWAEVDDPNDLREAEYIFNHRKRRSLLEQGFGGYWNYELLDFCFIRNMYFPPESMISAIKNHLPKLLHNYGSTQILLNEKLSYVTGYSQNRLILLNGASQVYPILQNYFKDRRVLLPDPTFGEYSRIFPKSLTYSDPVCQKKVSLKAQVDQADLIVIVNPNNPSGSIIPSKKVLELIQKYPHKDFIVDESFLEFSEEPSIMETLEQEAISNVMVIKSMSKSYGCPGVRLGYLYTCNSRWYQDILQQIPIWNTNSVAEFMLEIFLKYKNELKCSFEYSKKDRETFRRTLSQLPFIEEVYPSQSHHILVKWKEGVGKPHEILDALLNEYAILVKDVSHKFKDGDTYFRLAVRLPQENHKLVKRLKKIVKSMKQNH